jgi:GT2 family glycosyltransferase
LLAAIGNVVAFLDDDAYAHPAWLEHLLGSYADSAVGAVGGRALNNQPGEAETGAHEIGRLKANGTLTGYFAADPGRTIEVAHVMGCNMSFRREVLAELGGFREDYPGISGVREDTDMCLRVSRLNRRILFNPLACVDHVGAPQAKGRRFDARYMFFAVQNHCVMLQRNFGWSSPFVWRFLGVALADAAARGVRRLGGAFLQFGAVLWGLTCGFARAAISSVRRERGPIRTGPDAATLAEWLSKHPVSGIAVPAA